MTTIRGGRTKIESTDTGTVAGASVKETRIETATGTEIKTGNYIGYVIGITSNLVCKFIIMPWLGAFFNFIKASRESSVKQLATS